MKNDQITTHRAEKMVYLIKQVAKWTPHLRPERWDAIGPHFFNQTHFLEI